MANISALSAAVSGLQKSSARAETAALKIANLGSGTSTRSAPVSLQSGLGGSNAVDTQIFAAESVDLVREFANLIEAEMAYKSNTKVLQSAETMAKQTHDLLA